ncbi:MAG: hypothetical protein M1820_008106 [Bogoriella megaspora]|nr:MAG: hypothetical protein M1820_008106 [Bogoriella megaspora]
MALPLPHSGRSSPASKNAIDEIPFKGSEVYLQIFDNDMYNEVLAFTDDEEDTDKDELAERLEPDDEEMIEEHIPPTEQRIWSKLTGSDGSVTREERAWAENEMAEFIAKPEIETENVLKNSSSGPSAFNSKSIAEGYPSLSEAQEPQNAKGGLGSKTGHELQEAAGEAAPVRRRGTQRGQAPNHHVRSRSMIAKERNKNWGFLPPSGTQPKVVSRQCSVCGQRIIDDKEPVYTADGLYVAMKSAMLLEPSGEEKISWQPGRQAMRYESYMGQAISSRRQDKKSPRGPCCRKEGKGI